MSDPELARTWLRTENPNLDAAWNYAETNRLDQHIIALAAGLAETLRIDGPWTRALQIQQAAEAASRADSPATHATALNELGQVQRLASDYPAAADVQERALEIYRQIGDRLGKAGALNNLGRVRYLTGDYAAAADVQEQSLKIYRQRGNRGNEAWALNSYAATIAALGDRSRAFTLYQQALAMNRELNKPDDEANSLEGIAASEPAQGVDCLT
ncbi:hypothetical protein GCM10009839_18050 [Catenulispora yoronensis]|uniref:Tetratricopeptide repeat protein n=1 Tax=Catenulispora yoronensis TaxID=450799 RepID=A0ABP5FCM1_9ACTN